MAMPASASRMRRRSCSTKAGSGAAVPDGCDAGGELGRCPRHLGLVRVLDRFRRGATVAEQGVDVAVEALGGVGQAAIGRRAVSHRGSPISAARRRARYWRTRALPLLMPRATAVSATRLALEEAKLEHPPIVVGQASQEGLHAGRGRVVALGLGARRLIGRLPAGRHVIRPDERKPVEGAPVVGDGVVRDAVQPRGHLARVARSVELLDGAHEDLRGQVLGVGVVADARVDEPIDPDDVLVVDALERARTGGHLTDAVRPPVTPAVAAGRPARRPPRGSGRRSRRRPRARSRRRRSRR